MSSSRTGRTPARAVLITHDTRPQAESTVAYLETAGVHLSHVVVAGTDLRLVQDPEAEPRPGRTAALAAAAGAWVGVVVGTVVALLARTELRDRSVLLLCLVAGAALGAGLGALAEVAARERRAPAPGRLVATRFDVLVPEDQLQECRTAMSHMTRRGAV